MQRIIATFPATFGLRGFPGRTFELSPESSYFSGPAMGPPSRPVLWVRDVATGLDVAKGSPAELRAQIVGTE